MTDRRDETEAELRGSNPNASGPDSLEGGIGVSSERVGHTGPGRVSTDGVKDTSVVERDDEHDDTPPEQSTGNVEEKPEGQPPKAGYPDLDPRSGD